MGEGKCQMIGMYQLYALFIKKEMQLIVATKGRYHYCL